MVLRILSIFFLLFSIQHIGLGQDDQYELKTGHPRIILTKYGELALRFIITDDELATNLQNELKKDADKFLTSKHINYSLDSENSMLEISREYLKRILTLSLAYRMFEENKYSDKAIEQMIHVCSFPDWNPQYFLDVAEMTTALAIGYDWNYYHMNKQERETIRNKIVEFGLVPGLDVYKNAMDKTQPWGETKNNWSQVCAGGLILGALAVGEDFPELKNNIIYEALKNLIPTLDLYKPDGVWYEGIDSWEYSNTYLAMMISSLESSLENDFRISTWPGVDKTAEYYVNTISSTGTSYTGTSVGPGLFWFGQKFELPEVTSFYKSRLESDTNPSSPGYGKERGRLFYMALPWFIEGETD